MSIAVAFQREELEAFLEDCIEDFQSEGGEFGSHFSFEKAKQIMDILYTPAEERNNEG